MAHVPRLVPFNDVPPLDKFKLSSGYPSIRLVEKSAQAFDKAASDCMVSVHGRVILVSFPYP